MNVERSTLDRVSASLSSSATEQILGIQFFHGTPEEAVARMSENGGLLVAPSGTCFERFLEDAEYRRAIVTADLALPDSGAMVALWRLRTGRSLCRISGLTYLKTLLATIDLREVLWVLPHARAEQCLRGWTSRNSAIRNPHSAISTYLAPIYGREVSDPALVDFIKARQPRHVIIAIGAGAQEKLGWYLRENLVGKKSEIRNPGGHRHAATVSDPQFPPPPNNPSPITENPAPPAPSIHCIGGALGFITGDQNPIPDWADRLYLGWFLRFLAQPRAFLPRLWKARLLPGLIARYGADLPPTRN